MARRYRRRMKEAVEPQAAEGEVEPQEEFVSPESVSFEVDAPDNSQILAPEPVAKEYPSPTTVAATWRDRIAEKRWSGIPLFECKKCGWQSFKERDARKHYC